MSEFAPNPGQSQELGATATGTVIERVPQALQVPEAPVYSTDNIKPAVVDHVPGAVDPMGETTVVTPEQVAAASAVSAPAEVTPQPVTPPEQAPPFSA